MNRTTWIVLILSVLAVATTFVVMKRRQKDCGCNGGNGGCDCKSTPTGEQPSEETQRMLEGMDNSLARQLEGDFVSGSRMIIDDVSEVSLVNWQPKKEAGIILCWCEKENGDLVQKPCGTSCISINRHWTEGGQTRA